MRTIVYIDGFNLYYGALRTTPYKWLDISKLCSLIFPQDQIVKIRYFTARISAVADSDKPIRQQVYLRALRTLAPLVSIHFGSYMRTRIRAALVHPPPDTPHTVEVWRDEEKGSDVNLGTYMLLDAFDGRMDTAIVLSNDSDLLLPIQVVRNRFSLEVGLLNPHEHPSKSLQQHASFVKQVRPGALSASQFPDVIADERGEIRKPTAWGAQLERP